MGPGADVGGFASFENDKNLSSSGVWILWKQEFFIVLEPISSVYVSGDEDGDSSRVTVESKKCDDAMSTDAPRQSPQWEGGFTALFTGDVDEREKPRCVKRTRISTCLL